MASILTKICDRCGAEGSPGYSYARIEFYGRTGTVRVQDLCPACEALMEAWMEHFHQKEEQMPEKAAKRK